MQGHTQGLLRNCIELRTTETDEGVMLFVDKPYLSEFLERTIAENGLPVVETAGARALGLAGKPYLLSEAEAVERFRASMQPPVQPSGRASGRVKVYTTSENAIGWIAEHLSFTNLPEKIELFKNKARFREMVRPLHPDFHFQEVRLDQLRSLDLATTPMPVVVKPSVGFFSMGVHRVAGAAQWEATVEAIEAELKSVHGLYPPEVMNGASFLVEQCLEGAEYAVDAYYDAQGQPVVLNIMEHVFSSDDDVSDRVYMTSKAIIEENLKPFTEYLLEVGRLSGVTDFPVHAEIRRDERGALVPIEVNPLRFGGWCSTPDLAAASYGFNPYLYYFQSKRPNWNEILQGKEGLSYAVVVLDNATGVAGENIASFDYDALLAGFERPLELRKIDWRQYPVFGFVFTETREENFAELERILASDLSEFITRRQSR